MAAHKDDHDSHDTAHEAHDAHDDEHQDTPDPDEATIRTPWWLPLTGLSLLVVLAMMTYLFVSPGVLSPTTTGDAAVSADASAP
jgi:hypothetical protein